MVGQPVLYLDFLWELCGGKIRGEKILNVRSAPNTDFLGVVISTEFHSSTDQKVAHIHPHSKIPDIATIADQLDENGNLKWMMLTMSWLERMWFVIVGAETPKGTEIGETGASSERE
jgi:hypothetical protein